MFLITFGFLCMIFGFFVPFEIDFHFLERFFLLFFESFCEFLRILWIFKALTDLFELYGMFMITFGFLFIFFSLFGAFKIDFNRL